MNQEDKKEKQENNTLVDDGFGIGMSEYSQSGDERSKPDTKDGKAPGWGDWAIPHIFTFTNLVQSVIKTYGWSFDEALRHSHVNAMAMRRDPVIFSALRARQIPVTQLSWKLEMPVDDSHPAYAELSRCVRITEKAIKKTPGLNKLLLALQEAVWFGKAAVHVQYEWKLIEGEYTLAIKRWYPIQGDKIRYKWDGTPGIQIFPVNAKSVYPTDKYTVYWLTPQERDQFIIHNYEPEDPDFTEGLMAGSVYGVGLRHRLYWMWYLKNLVLGYLLGYLERVGIGGLTIFFYESDNIKSFNEIRDLVSRQLNQHIMLLPRNRDGSQGGPGVMRLDNSGSAIAMFQQLVNGYFDTLMQQLILGQTLTYTAGTATSDVAQLHADTFYRLVKHDALSLQDCLTRELVYIIFKYTFPHIDESLYPNFKFIIDPPNAPQLLEYATTLVNLGLAVDEGQLRDITGLQPPRHKERVANMNMPPFMPSASALPFLGPGGMQPATQGQQGGPVPQGALPQDVLAQLGGLGAVGGQAPAPGIQ